MVRHPPLLRLAGKQGLQDAHPGAAVQVPLLHPVPCLRRCPPQARGPALARGQRRRRPAGLRPGRRRKRNRSGQPALVWPRIFKRSGRCQHPRGKRGKLPALSPHGHAVDQRPARRPAGPDPARPHAAAHRPAEPADGRPAPARPAGRSHRAADDRDPHPATLPERRGSGLPHARPPVAHALRRRSAAHQPHHRAGHLAGQHALHPR